MRKANAKSLTLAAMGLGFVVVQLDVTVVNVALKVIGAAFHGGVSGLQWVVNAYTLGFAALILTAGALGDRLGARRVFIAGFLLFTAASRACGLAPTLGLLIAARAVQGVGAAILVPCSLSLLNHAYTEEQERAKAVGIWAACASLALAAGPLVGGALIAGLGWRSIFFINLPLGLIGIWLTWRYAEETTRSTERGFDLAGQSLAVVSLASLAASIIEGGQRGWGDAWVLGGFVTAAVALATFVFAESKQRSPMLPLALFKQPTFTAASLVGFLINIAFYGLIFAFSLYFQNIHGFTALRTGLAFLPMMAAILAANLKAGTIAAKITPRRLILIGEGLLAAGCFALLGTGERTSYWAMMGQLFAMGCGVGLIVPPMTSALLGSVERARSGVASGVLNTLRQTGSVIGVALFGALVGGPGRFIGGLHLSLLISGCLVLLGCVAALRIEPPCAEQKTEG